MNIEAIEKALEELREESDSISEAKQRLRSFDRIAKDAERDCRRAKNDPNWEPKGDWVFSAKIRIRLALGDLAVASKQASDADYALGDIDAALGLAPSWLLSPDWANWRALEEDGDWRWHSEKPKQYQFGWGSDDRRDYAGAVTDPTHWRDSLSQRPEALRDGEDQ